MDFGRAFERERPKLLRYAVRLTRDQDLAEDLVQATAVRAFNSEFDHRASLGTWLGKILKNAYIDHLRRHWTKREVHFSDLPLFDIAGTDESGLESEALIQALADLPERFRAPIALHGFEGLKCSEIGTVIGIPEATVRTRMMRGRAALAQSLAHLN